MTRLVSLAGRVAAWALAGLVTLLSVVPPALRPITDTPHNIEHFVIFFATGLAFGFGYSRRPVMVGMTLLLFAGIVEVAQIFVPDRHARLSDFVVDALAVCAGAILGIAASRTVALSLAKEAAN